MAYTAKRVKEIQEGVRKCRKMRSEGTLRSSVRTNAAPLQVNFLRYTTADQIREWLKAHDSSINHKSARDTCVEGTGSWFAEDERFRKWLDEPGTTMWISGGREYSLVAPYGRY
jgi:hypothetical protein